MNTSGRKGSGQDPAGLSDPGPHGDPVGAGLFTRPAIPAAIHVAGSAGGLELASGPGGLAVAFVISEGLQDRRRVDPGRAGPAAAAAGVTIIGPILLNVADE